MLWGSIKAFGVQSKLLGFDQGFWVDQSFWGSIKAFGVWSIKAFRVRSKLLGFGRCFC